MKNKSSILQARDQKPNSQGFTLPELLVAAVISLGVVAIGGFGLVSILRSSQVANAQNERRVELNRSLDFMAAEVRHADRILLDADNEPVPPGFNTSLPSGAELVLSLKMPAFTDVQQSVVYYTAPSPNNLWLGPKVVYRWGPKHNSDGTYSDPSDLANWSHEPLIDSIQDNNASPNCPDTDWTANGDLGFGACVDSTGKMAKLFHAGVYNTPLQGSDLYTANTTVATRNSRIFTVTGNPPGSPPSSPPSGPPNSPPGDTPTVTVLEQATMDIRVLGSEITCGVGGPPIGTSAAYKLTLGQQSSQSALSTVAPLGFQTNISVAPGTELATDGASTTGGSCSPNISASSDSNSNRVLTLRNGDSVPDYTPYGNQLPISTITQGYIDTNQRVSIADNQVIFLFELGSGSPGDASYDFQDIVIIATITPTSTTTVSPDSGG